MSAPHREDELQDSRLRELAARLGTAAAERLDADRTARAVIERLRAEPAERRWRWAQPAWLRIAAALVILFGAGLVARAVLQHGGPADHYVVEELVDLSAEELGQVLGSLDRTLDVATPGSTGEEMEGLDEEQLARVLGSLEG